MNTITLKKCAQVLFCAVLLSSTACSLSGGAVNSGEHGYFEIKGDSEGVRAFSDWTNGIITNTKAKDDQRSAFWQARDNQERARAARFFTVGGKK